MVANVVPIGVYDGCEGIATRRRVSHQLRSSCATVAALAKLGFRVLISSDIEVVERQRRFKTASLVWGADR